MFTNYPSNRHYIGSATCSVIKGQIKNHEHFSPVVERLKVNDHGGNDGNAKRIQPVFRLARTWFGCPDHPRKPLRLDWTGRWRAALKAVSTSALATQFHRYAIDGADIITLPQQSPGKYVQILRVCVVMLQYWTSSTSRQFLHEPTNASLASVVLIQPHFRPFITWELGNTR